MARFDMDTFASTGHCIGLCRLTDDEILAVAEHEHLPDILALELGNYLCETPEGELRVKRMIADDIEAAQRRGDLVHAAKLKRTLKHFIDHHAGQKVDAGVVSA